MTDDCVAPICAYSSLALFGRPTVGWGTAALIFLGVVACYAFVILAVMFDAVPLIYVAVGGVLTYFAWTQFGWSAGITAALVAAAFCVLAVLVEP